MALVGRGGGGWGHIDLHITVLALSSSRRQARKFLGLKTTVQACDHLAAIQCLYARCACTRCVCVCGWCVRANVVVGGGGWLVGGWLVASVCVCGWLAGCGVWCVAGQVAG